MAILACIPIFPRTVETARRGALPDSLLPDQLSHYKPSLIRYNLTLWV
jgi:hypothetical protein